MEFFKIDLDREIKKFFSGWKQATKSFLFLKSWKATRKAPIVWVADQVRTESEKREYYESRDYILVSAEPPTAKQGGYKYIIVS